MSLFRRLSFAAATLLALASPALAAIPALALALDTPSLSWDTGGDLGWTSQTAVTADGVDAARATGLANLDSSAWLETTVPAPGFLSWKWRLDLDSDGGSVLELLVGDETTAARSLYSSDGWASAEAVITGSSPVKLRWRLRRLTQADTPSSDTAYVDTVAFAPFGPPVLQSHADLGPRGFTARWDDLPRALFYVVETSRGSDFADSTLTSPVDAPSTALAITDLEPGTTYYYRVIAYGPEAISAVSASRSVSTPAVVHPANDAFAAATALSGISGSVNATTLEATVESDEPSNHVGSVWFRWTAPSAGLWHFQTVASASSSPLLHVYSGAALAELEPLAIGSSSDDGSTRVEFEALSGQTYRIALDSAGSAQGPTTLSWERLVAYTPPSNDAFAAPTALSGLSGAVNATNLYASAETGETASALHSVWFSWKAPASGVLTLDTTGGAIPAILSIWSGANLSALTLLDSDSATPPAASQVSLPVAKDTVYRISLDGQSGSTGALRLTWSLAVPSTAQTIIPPEIADRPIDAPPITLEAVASSGLPVSFALVSGPATLDGEVLSLAGQAGLVKLRAIQPGDGVYLPAEALFQFTVQAPPANDLAASPQTLAGASGVIQPDLRYATSEIGDGYPAHRSLWYRWTASATGVLTLDTAGAAIPVTLTVYAGSPGAFETAASDTRTGVRPHLEVPVVGGIAYTIALDTLEDAGGIARLSWSFSPPALSQAINFPALPDLGVSSVPFLLEADASSGLPIRFTLVSGPATLVGNLVSLTGKAGNVSIRASQSGDSYYKPAADVLVTFAVRPPPANDNLASAARLPANASGSVNGSNIDASPELGDPAPANRSVWWIWTAPATGQWTVDTAGSAQPVTLSILSGPSASALELISADLRAGIRGRLTVSVYKGTTYWIAVDSLDGSQDAVKLSWSLAAPALEQTILFEQPLPDLIVGDPAPALMPSASSDLPVGVAVVSGPASIVDGALVLSGKTGKITLRATQPGDARYKAAAPVVRSFTVRPLPAIKITLSDLKQPYDGTPRQVLALADPAPRVSPLAVTYNGSPDAPKDAGTYTVVATADNSRATAKLVIAKLPLLVTADNQYRYAGEENPPLTFHYSGFAPGDDETKLLVPPVAKTPATVTSPGGAYPIRVSGASAANYTFSYAPGILTVDTFAGRYEGLLYGGSGDPVGKLELTVAASGRTYTGRIVLAREANPVPLLGELDLSSVTGLAGDTLVTGAYRLAFDLALDGGFTATLEHDGAYFAIAPSGRRVFVPAAGQKLAWSGAHTALLSPVSASAALAPAGSGHATAAIDAKGNLKLSGRLGDDTPFTATLAPDSDGAYRLFVLPYPSLRDSYLAGEIPLFSHPDTTRLPGRRHIPASAGVTLTWIKTASTAKAYPAGFGPLYPTLTLDPWLRPAAAFPVSVSFAPFDLDFGARVAALPSAGQLSTAGLFTLVAPVTTPANLARFSLKADLATGAFNGSFVLSDQVLPAPAKPEQRTIAIHGVLRSPASAEIGSGVLLGSGSFVLQPLSNSTDTQSVSGEIRLARP